MSLACYCWIKQNKVLYLVINLVFLRYVPYLIRKEIFQMFVIDLLEYQKRMGD